MDSLEVKMQSIVSEIIKGNKNKTVYSPTDQSLGINGSPQIHEGLAMYFNCSKVSSP